MAEAGRNLASKRWALLGEYRRQLVDGGLSLDAAVDRIRREFLHRELPYRYRLVDVSGSFCRGDLSDSFWSNADFDFMKSWVTGIFYPDRTFAHISRQVAETQRWARQFSGAMFGHNDENPQAVGPRTQTIVVEVLIETREQRAIAQESIVVGSRSEMKHEPAATVSSLGKTKAAKPASLRLADKEEIEEEIAKLYTELKAANQKPPNVNELPEHILPRLERRGLKAARIAVKTAGGKFKDQRLGQGERWTGPK